MAFCWGPRASGLPLSKKLHITKISYFGKASHNCIMQNCHSPTFYFANFDLPSFYGILLSSRASSLSQSKNLHGTKIIFWYIISKLFYAKMPNSNFLSCKLEFTLILRHFAEVFGASRFRFMKKFIKAKSPRPGSITTLLLCKMSKFQILIFGPWPTGRDLCSPQGTYPDKFP